MFADAAGLSGRCVAAMRDSCDWRPARAADNRLKGEMMTDADLKQLLTAERWGRGSPANGVRPFYLSGRDRKFAYQGEQPTLSVVRKPLWR